ncbi:hypothetical protein Bca4012_022124 [Brassica carinata]
MALINTSSHKVDLRSSSKRSDSESRANNEELLKMSEAKRKISGRSVSLPSIDILLDEKPGWPFLKTAQVHHWHSRKVSVVNWVMSLPDRFPDHQQNLHSETTFVKKQLKDILKDNNKWFSYNVLKTATSDFSQENLIGKGGCSEVYRGVLKDGKGIAVKILKSLSKEAMTGFVHEIDIISSLSHQNISELLGVCVQDNDLISVYNLSSTGSLEETLHGRDPISPENPKGEESLVMWAKPFFETGNEKGLLDPDVTEISDETQFHRMVLAATHCLTRSATHRPSIRQILRLLRGVDEVEKWSKRMKEEVNEDCFDDEVYPNIRAELHLSLAMMLEVEDDESGSISPMERSYKSLFSSCCSSRELQP